MTEHNDRICEKIVLEMKSQGINRKHLAEALHITYNQMCNILNNRCALTINRLYDISKILDTPVAILMED